MKTNYWEGDVCGYYVHAWWTVDYSHDPTDARTYATVTSFDPYVKDGTLVELSAKEAGILCEAIEYRIGKEINRF